MSALPTAPPLSSRFDIRLAALPHEVLLAYTKEIAALVPHKADSLVDMQFDPLSDSYLLVGLKSGTLHM